MQIKSFTLGGLDELGKVCFVIEIQDEIYVFDAGLKYFNNIDLGDNIIIPDFDYLIKNKNKIKGIFITKIDISDAYSIKYLLSSLKNKITIYTSKINKDMMSDIGLLTKEQVTKNVKIIQDYYVKIGKNQVKKFNTASNLPGSCGFSIKTNDGLIIYTGSFVLETNKENNIFNTNLNNIKNDNKKVLLLISNVSNANTNSFSVPKTRVDKWLNKAIDSTRENIYICCYDNDWYKIHNIIKNLEQFKEKFNISFFDKKFHDFYLKIMKNTDPIYNSVKFIDFTDIKRSHFKRNVIILTGDQKWLFSRITRLISQRNLNTKLTKKDSVLLLGENKFNLELSIVNILNELYRTDAKIFFISQKEIIPVEAGIEDLRYLCNQIEPEYFIPFNAYHKEIYMTQKKLSDSLDKNKILVLNNGDVVTFKNGIKTKEITTVKNGSVFINTLTFDNVKESILNERRILGTFGIVFVSLGFGYKNEKYTLSTKIKIDFIGINSNEKKLLNIEKKIKTGIKDLFINKINEIKIPSNISILVKKISEKIIKKEINNLPFIIPMIKNI